MNWEKESLDVSDDESKIKLPNKAKYNVKKSIFSVLREAILSGEIYPGAILHESALVKQFGASRSPVREALVQLEQEGLVVTLPKRGTIVTKIYKSQLRQSLFIRNSLEVTNIELLSQKITDNQMATLHLNLEKQREALEKDNYIEIYDAMDEFHFLLCDFNNLPRVWEIIRREKLPLDRIHHLHELYSPRVIKLYDQHLEIFEALKVKDVEKCKSLIENHTYFDYQVMELINEDLVSGVEPARNTMEGSI